MDRYYTTEHLWILPEKECAVIGLTKQITSQLLDIQVLDFPGNSNGAAAEIKKGDVICSIESAKMTLDVYSPADGTLIQTNPELESDPNLLLRSPEEEGWLCKISPVTPENLAEFFDLSQYEEYVN